MAIIYANKKLYAEFEKYLSEVKVRDHSDLLSHVKVAVCETLPETALDSEGNTCELLGIAVSPDSCPIPSLDTEPDPQHMFMLLGRIVKAREP